MRSGVFRENGGERVTLTTITINITCSQEPLQEPVLSIVEMPTYIHTTDNNQIARGELLKMFFKKIQQRL